MSKSLSLDTTLRQQQRLTPLQVQFVRMLEMTAPEIEETVRRAIDEMPALEVRDLDPQPEATAADTSDADDDTPYYLRRANNRSADDAYYDPAGAASERGETLMESLAAQAGVTDMTPKQRLISAHVIGNIDDNGYITRDLASMAVDISAATGVETTPEEVNDVWQAIRRFDPPGIGAVDLRDCLLLQLRRLPASRPVDDAVEIVAHYFDLFSHKQFDRIKTAVGLDDDRLRAAIDVIRHLNPKPGASFSSGAPADDTPRHVVPDFAVEPDGDSLSLVSLSHIPELAIEKTFDVDTPITSRSQRDAAGLFIRTKRNEAQEFIKILTMRRETLYRVMQAIVKIQRDFFMTGDENAIRPMILKDISRLTGYGLSVISRATAGKYVATPYGTFPLKMLFNERPKEDSDTSSHQINASLRRLIAAEDKSRPMSDEALTAALVGEGFDIARRTVAKYREKLGFPVARLRREV